MFFIAMISIIIYIIAIIAIYHNVYYLEKNKKIKFIIMSLVLMLIITMVLVWISSNNIQVPNKEFKAYEKYIGITKNTSILLFAPINTIIFMPYIGNLINKYAVNEISEDEMKRKFLVLLVIAAVIGTFEIAYIKDFQIGLLMRI